MSFIVIVLLASLTAALPAQKAQAPASPSVPKADTARSALTEAALSGLAFRNIGPAIMSGRISDIAIHP